MCAAFSFPEAALQTAQPALQFARVALSYGNRLILDDFSLDITPGEFVCVVGPSGCGKTTLLRLVSGLLRPTSGEVLLFGEAVTAPRRDVAVVFQDYDRALLPWRTVAGNVMLALECMGVARASRRDVAAQLLAKVGLQNHMDHYPVQLSGGMQQRLQIARCLAQQPRVLLMDEPFGALDAMTRATLQDEVLRIAAESGTTVLFITHDLEEAVYLGDRVVAMAANPGRMRDTVSVRLPAPRSQIETREHAEFLRLRHRLYGLVQEHA
jgi:NitT/TauT family transport system ATP-binding protein